MLNASDECPRFSQVSRLVTIVGIGITCLTACGGGGGGNDTPSGNDGGSPPPPTTSPPPSGGAQVDTTPPSPPANVAASAISASEIRLTWTVAAAAEEVASYKIHRGGSTIATVQTADYADAGLTAGTAYCYDVTAVDVAGNESGHSAQACATTAALSDTTAPTVTSSTPTRNSVDVAIDASIRVVFSEAMNPSTLTQATFTLTDENNRPVNGAVSYSGTTATFDPTEVLASAETYTATISVDASDAAGNTLASAHSWTFKTGLAMYAIRAVGEDHEGDDEELFTLVVDLNERGEVAGEAMRSWNLGADNPMQESIAFLWRDGRLIDLAATIASPESRSQGLNDRGEVVGWSYQGVDVNPTFLWRDETFSNLPLNGAHAINNAGQVVGYVNRTVDYEVVSVPVIWRSGQFTELEGLVNPWNINEAGAVVGFTYVELREQAALWQAGAVTLLGKLPQALNSQAFDVNLAGVVVGTNYFAPPVSPGVYDRAFIWESGKMTELPRLAADHTSTSAYGINDRGHAVGRSGDAQPKATIWIDGEALDLNDLIAPDDPLKPYITLLEGREINNRGQIIVQAADSRRSGSFSGYLLTPIGPR